MLSVYRLKEEFSGTMYDVGDIKIQIWHECTRQESNSISTLFSNLFRAQTHKHVTGKRSVRPHPCLWSRSFVYRYDRGFSMYRATSGRPRRRRESRGLLIALIIEAASTSETSVNSIRLQDTTSCNTAIFIHAAVRTWKLTFPEMFTGTFRF
jgi:hypothetical protein